MINNVDIFKDLYSRIRDGASEKEILQDFGGSSIYIPSYKTLGRDDDIWEEYQILKEKGYTKKHIMLSLQKQFALSEQRLYEILADKRQPALF